MHSSNIAQLTIKRKAPFPGLSGAEDETRTRDPHLGKVMLYQLSYFCFFWEMLPSKVVQK
jgi:hypothetical protein